MGHRELDKRLYHRQLGWGGREHYPLSAAGLFQPALQSPNPPSPAITRGFDGGLNPNGEKTLEIALNLPNGGNTDFVSVTFTFNAATYATGVENVAFKLFDIDQANASGNTYQDRVFNISATTVDGATLTPTFSNLGSTVVNTGGVLTGNGSATDLGAGSGNGNAQINFGGSFIRSITFSYGSSTASTYSDPTYQHIGIHDMTFTPVPEINPTWSAVVSCFFAMGLVFRHRATVRK